VAIENSNPYVLMMQSAHDRDGSDGANSLSAPNIRTANVRCRCVSESGFKAEIPVCFLLRTRVTATDRRVRDPSPQRQEHCIEGQARFRQ